ncbi:hypothetical protein INT44_003161 [Umbelopsis vinacea]|uniref:Uncharacterized protein n=1 Tax=Umbelopsis vinacea TaxID=44442 RepID=A0A8H7Q876_9FUNG|nr:hypothetical protein INT44_003161 [Umbelopsis vinacea]
MHTRCASNPKYVYVNNLIHHHDYLHLLESFSRYHAYSSRCVGFTIAMEDENIKLDSYKGSTGNIPIKQMEVFIQNPTMNVALHHKQIHVPLAENKPMTANKPAMPPREQTVQIKDSQGNTDFNHGR